MIHMFSLHQVVQVLRKKKLDVKENLLLRSFNRVARLPILKEVEKLLVLLLLRR